VLHILFLSNLKNRKTALKKCIIFTCHTDFASCKFTGPTDKICRNTNKICMTSQNYKFVQCIFPIFQFLKPCGICRCVYEIIKI
jgi:hypothetical protein